MNKQLLSILLAGTVLSAGTSMAQFTPDVTGNKTAEITYRNKMADSETRPLKIKKMMKIHHQKMAKRLAADLGLSDEQVTQAEKIREDGRAKMEPLMEQMMKLRGQIDQERRANMQEFEKILTPEQKQKFQDIIKRGPEGFAGRPERAGMRPFKGHPGEHRGRQFEHQPREYDSTFDGSIQSRHMMRGMHPIAPEDMPLPPHDGMMPTKPRMSDYNPNGGFVTDEEMADEMIAVDQGGFVEE